MSINSLNILIWNARSIKKKELEFFNLLISDNVDIALVSETWLTYNISLSHPTYDCYRLDRVHTSGGGVAIIVKKSIKHTLRTSLRLKVIEEVGIDVTLNNNSKVSIFSVYFPGRKRNIERSAYFKSDLNKLLRINNKAIIGGDLNCRHQSWNCLRSNHWGGILYDVANSSQHFSLLYPATPTYIPSSPTKNPSTLDFFITNCANFCSVPLTLNMLSSDHLPVKLTLSDAVKINSGNLCYNYSAANWNLYKAYLNSNLPLDNSSVNPIVSNDDVDSLCSHLVSSIKAAADLAIPKRSLTRIQDTHLPENILYLIRLRNAERRKWLRYRIDAFLYKVKLLNAEIKRQIATFRNMRWNNLLSTFDKASKPFWKITKIIKNRSSNIPPLKLNDNLFITPTEKANILADTFSLNHTISMHLSDAVTETEVAGSIQELSRTPVLNPCQTNANKVSELIKGLKSKKSPGMDNINNKLLKALPPSGIKYLTFIFNACLRNCYFPNCWKTAKVIPIPKPGKPKNNPESYRPISLLSCLSKLLEKLIKEQIDKFVIANNVLPSFQFGFRTGHNTVHQVLRIKNHISKNFVQKKSTGLVLLDIEKAFDTVWHDALCHKLFKLKLPIPLIKIIQSFLSARKYVVKINKDISSTHYIQYGVPQGSVLGPILFNLYVSDLPCLGSNIHVAMFADDTAIFSSGSLFADVYNSLQDALNELLAYFSKWKIKINCNKTQAVWFSRCRKPCFLPNGIELNMFSESIKWSDDCRYLGIVLDKKLTFQKHVSNTIDKINKIVRMLYPLVCRKSKLSNDNKTLLFKTIFQAILLYGAPVWSNCARTHRIKLQRCQNKILKMMFNLPWHHSTLELHNDANVKTLEFLTEKINNNFFIKCSTSDNLLISQLAEP